jgi:hypothetical protein
MDRELQIILSADWHACPTWWKNMVNHLVHVHATSQNKIWEDLNPRKVINDHLHEAHGATYERGSHVIFPSESDYCACVLQWS